MLTEIVPLRLNGGKTQRHQRRVNSRRWDKAARWIQDRVSPQALKTYLVIQRLSCGRPSRLSKRLLASKRGVSTKTIYNHTSELIAAKVMRAVYSKITYNRNAPNLYIFLDIDGNDMERNCMEKPLQLLKRKTPRAVRVVDPSVRKLHEWNGRLMRENRGLRAEWRLEKAQERTRRYMAARIGAPDKPLEPPTEAQEREWKALHDRELQRSRERREAREKAMLERPKVCGECGGSGFSRRFGNRCKCMEA